jgi:hypothetical protein
MQPIGRRNVPPQPEGEEMGLREGTMGDNYMSSVKRKGPQQAQGQPPQAGAPPMPAAPNPMGFQPLPQDPVGSLAVPTNQLQARPGDMAGGQGQPDILALIQKLLGGQNG